MWKHDIPPWLLAWLTSRQGSIADAAVAAGVAWIMRRHFIDALLCSLLAWPADDVLLEIGINQRLSFLVAVFIGSFGSKAVLYGAKRLITAFYERQSGGGR